MVVTSCARSAVDVSVPADASSSVEADETVSTISPTAASNESASLTMSALRCWAAIWSCLILASASSRAFCSETTLNFSTAPATAPSSSLRPRPGSTTAKLPPASSSIDTLNARIGRLIVK
jgi:outer membrane murein-binding lipoprotein Lpp